MSATIAKHHTEWLSLLDISGPFLSLPTLKRAFPQGLDAHDPDLARRLRLAYAEWTGSLPDDPPGGHAQRAHTASALHRRWVEFVLTEVLGFSQDRLAEEQRLPPALRVPIPEHGETLIPDFAVLDKPGRAAAPEGAPARLLVQVYPAAQPLDRALPDRRWAAKPDARMAELLRATGVRLGLVTNGEHWMLVHAPRGAATTYVSWYAALWLDEPLTLRAFRSLLASARFFGVAEDDTLEALFDESSQYQHEVTDQLGLQVRRAVKILVQALDRADQERNDELLRGVSEAALYEAALTVMMRLVFLFSAEERGLLLLGDPLYDQNYAVSTLGAQLREAADQFGEEVMEHRFDAWYRLLATFRAVHGGVRHDRLTLPAYGSRLFDPQRFPFLEQALISNRVTLHLLDALQWLRAEGEPRRLSFRGLDIEQIGHVYEGLLDHAARRAPELMLGLSGADGREPELPLAELEARRAQGEAMLLDYLREHTGRSLDALRRALAQPPSPQATAKLRAACHNDEALLARVLPFASLLRDDDFGQPVVIHAGSAYVTQATTRRATGTHYTPRSLTEAIVQRTLEPLVYHGPADGAPRECWRLRSPAELLRLKVCDPAMGSGAFLVQACRYLAERLVEAWDALAPPPRPGQPHPRVTPEGAPASGKPDEQLIPNDPEERLIFARRLVADRCLYGVDKNPMAVEMAKLSLWLITLDKGRPFTFLDHAFKCGDSLVGASEGDYRRWASSTRDAGTRMVHADALDRLVDAARDKRRELESFSVREPRDAERKAALLREADEALAKVKLGCDLLTGVKLLGLTGEAAESRNAVLVEAFVRADLADLRAGRSLSREAAEALEAARRERAFHWHFEFPEVFLDPNARQVGFDAILGNPPFLGGQRISGGLGKHYLGYLNATWSHTRGSADLCAYFFLRAFDLLRPGGTFGLLATNTIAQGDTRERGLDFIVANDGVIYHAVSSMPWPSDAAVHVSVVHVAKGGYAGARCLDGRPVAHITPLLDDAEAGTGKPHRLAANANKSFQGSIVLGMGFVLTPEAAQQLIDKDPRNRDVLFPYLNGEDLNSRPDQSPSRWVINFFDWPLDRSAEGCWATADEAQRATWLRLGRVPPDYPGRVAADYPDCLAIVERLVKPERERYDETKNSWNRSVKERWWLFGSYRANLHATIAPLKRVLVIALTSRTAAFVFISTGIVFSHATGVFAFDLSEAFALLQSSIHIEWAWRYASSMKGDLRYTPADVFETFPFPPSVGELEGLGAIGERYHERRREMMLARQEGLTAIYNRFHDPKETASDIVELRALHVELDQAVVAAYGWGDLDFGHGFHETAQGVRYTLSEPARRRVLARLLELNHTRHAEEQRAAQPRAPKARRPLARRTPAQSQLLDL